MNKDKTVGEKNKDCIPRTGNHVRVDIDSAVSALVVGLTGRGGSASAPTPAQSGGGRSVKVWVKNSKTPQRVLWLVWPKRPPRH